MGIGLNYLLTAFDSDNKLMQIHLEAEGQRFNGPIDCCTNAASTNFWRAELKELGVRKVTNIKPLHASVKRK